MLSITCQTVHPTVGDRVAASSVTVWNLVILSLATALLGVCQARWGPLVKKVSIAMNLTNYGNQLVINELVLLSSNCRLQAYPSGLPLWYRGSHTIAPVPVKQCWGTWVSELHKSWTSAWYYCYFLLKSGPLLLARVVTTFPYVCSGLISLFAGYLLHLHKNIKIYCSDNACIKYNGYVLDRHKNSELHIDTPCVR